MTFTLTSHENWTDVGFFSGMGKKKRFRETKIRQPALNRPDTQPGINVSAGFTGFISVHPGNNQQNPRKGPFKIKDLDDPSAVFFSRLATDLVAASWAAFDL